MRVRLVWVAVLIAIVGISGALLAANPQPGQRSSELSGHVLVFNCAGDYGEMDLTSGALITGTLWSQPSWRSVVPSDTSRYDGCLLFDVDGYPQRNLAYAVVPMESRVRDARTKVGYNLVEFSTQNLMLTESRPVTTQANRYPWLFTGAQPDGLLLALPIDKSAWTLRRYAVPGLQLLGEQQTSTPPVQPGAEVKASGLMISLDSILDRDGHIKANIKNIIRGVGPSEGRGTFPEHRGTLLDAANDVALVVENGDNKYAPRASSTLLTYSIAVPKLRSVVIAPAVYPDPASTNAHLSPSGDRILVDQYAWRETSDGVTVPASVGRVYVYDSRTGKQVREIDLGGPPGYPTRVLNWFGDGRYIVFTGRSRLYVLDLVEGVIAKEVDLPSGFVPTAALVTGVVAQ